MTTKAAKPAPEEEPTPDHMVVTHEDAGFGQWEFLHKAPTRPQVLELLASLPDVYGVAYADFAEHVQALPQRKKVVKKLPNGRPNEIWFDSWALYMSVPGRVAMLQAIADQREWVVDFEPEPVTPTGVPGWLTDGKEEGRIVYREYLTIRTLSEDGVMSVPLGRKPGTAWVPYSGGQQAAGSNPYEKVETSARGRAIAAWGIGVLPGSGIASVEEIEQAFAMKAEADAGGRGSRPAQQQEPQSNRPTREDLLEQAKTVAEQYRALAGMSEESIEEKVGNYFRERLGIQKAYHRDQDGLMVLDYTPVKDGQLQMLINDLTAGLRKLEADGPL